MREAHNSKLKTQNSKFMIIRTGFGYDVHKLVEGRELWLGGIRLDYPLGLLGHSDADVLIHAICDALLGAANMRYRQSFSRYCCRDSQCRQQDIAA